MVPDTVQPIRISIALPVRSVDLALGLWCRVAWCCYTPEDLYRTGFSIAVRGEIDDLMIIDRTLQEMVGGRFLSHSLKDLYRLCYPLS